MDRNFPGVPRIQAMLAAGTHVLIRVRDGITLRRAGGFLPDGSYPAEISGGGITLTIRVTEYRVSVAGRDAPELFCLITDLHDHDAYPARVLARAYHWRWIGSETENASGCPGWLCWGLRGSGMCTRRAERRSAGLSWHCLSSPVISSRLRTRRCGERMTGLTPAASTDRAAVKMTAAVALSRKATSVMSKTSWPGPVASSCARCSVRCSARCPASADRTVTSRLPRSVTVTVD
jgi:hypothetical protein